MKKRKTTKKKQATQTTALVPRVEMGVQEAVLVLGNLAVLSDEQRSDYYLKVCRSLGLNPFTKPFGYIELNKKIQLYALKDCTEQLRKIHGVSVVELVGKFDGDLYIVTATGKDKSGKVDCATGAVYIKNLFGDARANAIMKAETKAKRRLTLSICGLGILDEQEAESVPDAKVIKAEILVESDKSAPTPQAPAPVKVREKTPEEVVKAFPQLLKDKLKAAGFDGVKKAHAAYLTVSGDLDALAQLCDEKIESLAKAAN